MPCYSPLRGFRSRHLGPSGKRGVTFRLSEGFADLPVLVPCGQCIGCRLERSRQWAVRCMHEAALHEDNCFLTLTYDDAHLPLFGSLDRGAFPAFIKRLRSRFAGRRVRYFHCGEYGERTGRPHYHACVFGFDFADRYKWAVRCGRPAFRSATLESLWPFGASEIGSVTFESAAYVARYICKKVTGANAEAYYSVVAPETGEVVRREPEFVTMSRRPGIGRGWYERFRSEVYPADEVVMRGAVMKPPRYYDKVLEVESPEVLDEVRLARKRCVVKSEVTEERLLERERFTVAKLNLFAGRDGV